MKNRRKEVDYGDSKIPQSTLQAVFSLFWPLNSNLKKFIFVVALVLVGLFAVWVSLPEKTKTEIIDHLKDNKNVQFPAIVTKEKVPPTAVKKQIPHTEGNQSPATSIHVESSGDQSPNIVDNEGSVTINSHNSPEPSRKGYKRGNEEK
jgi:regulatory protein YycI of two-component signal transduction system YycFG